ncbi:MAG: methyltransferase domain-containing protein [Gaiellaceae bacterium]
MPRLNIELERAALSHADFVGELYRLALRRDPEPGALAEAVTRLDAGTLSRATLIRDLVESEEFDRLRALDDAVAFAAWARKAGERPRELRARPNTDERAIEIAWCLSRYRGEPRVLDVGYAFADPVYLASLLNLGASSLVGVDLADADVPQLRGVQADVRDLPFEARSFDVVFCISTIEHVGADNERYGSATERDGMREGLSELRRVGERVLLTVPCGEPEDHGWFVQDEPDAWRARFRQAGFVIFEDEAYELAPEGWRSAPAFAPAGVRYGERGPGASAVLCVELRPRTPGRVMRQSARGIRSRSARVFKRKR